MNEKYEISFNSEATLDSIVNYYEKIDLYLKRKPKKDDQ